MEVRSERCRLCGGEVAHSTRRMLTVCRNPDCGHTEPLPAATTVGRAPGSEVALVDALPWILGNALRAQLTEVSHPIMRLHRLCDALEILTRFLTLVGWMDLRRSRSGPFPKVLAAAFAKNISRPTFGMWAGMLREVATACRNEKGLLVPEISDFALNALLPRLGSGDKPPETSVIALRNLLAHGGAMTHDAAGPLLEAHEGPALTLWEQARFLTELALGQVQSGRVIRLKGSDAEPRGAEVATMTAEELGRREKHIILMRGEDGISLWPLVDFDRAQLPGPAGAREDLQYSALLFQRAEPDFVLYTALSGKLPLSKRSDLVQQFAELFQMAVQRSEARSSVVEDFRDEIRADAERLVGRRKELEELREVTRLRQEGVLWITGPGGIGKTMLMAKLASDLANSDRRGTLLVAYRFKAGDSRCSRVGFLRLSVTEISAWLGQFLPGYRQHLPAPDLAGLEDQFDSLLQLVGSLQPSDPRGARAPRLVIVLDGLDELIRYDPDFPDFVLKRRVQNVLWVCAGRPEGNLIQYFSSDRCEHVFPQGLPGIGEDDVRAMLVEGCAAGKYSLIRRDLQRGNTVQNPFITAVVRRADGLPLYVRFLTDDINRGELGFDDEARLPVGLAEYYEDLLRRAGISDLQAILTPVIVMICRAEGPLTLAAIDELLVWRGFLVGGPADTELVRGALDSAQGMLKPMPTPNRQLGYIPYHDTFRAHVRSSSRTKQMNDLARAQLAKAAVKWREFKVDGDARAYLQRHGLSHLLEMGRFAEAVDLLHDFRAHPDHCPALALADRQMMERDLLLAMNHADVADPSGATIDRERLLDLVLGLGDEFEIFRGSMRILLRHHRAHWERSVGQILASENWEAMYSASLAMAESYIAGDTGIYAEILALAEDPEMPRHELGLLALKLIASHGDTLDAELVRPFRQSASFIRRASLGELLISLAMRRVDVLPIVAADRLLESPWPYHQAQFEDVIAAQVVLRGDESELAMFPGVLRAVRELEDTETLRRALESAPGVAQDERLAALVGEYYALPTKLETIAQAEPSLSKSVDLLRLARLLFAHPSWEVRATAGVVIGGLWRGREELDRFLRDCLGDPNWKIRYAALDAVYSVRTSDGGHLFEEAVRRTAVDPHSWVRGLSADCLRDWIVKSDTERRATRLETFKTELVSLLNDIDMWPLEGAQLALRQLREAGTDVGWFIASARGGMLGHIDGWDGMSREALQNALDATR